MFLTVLLLAGFLFCGIFIFRDYGTSSDEINQIEAGHIIWTAICEKLGRPAPDFGNLPKLNEYYNRYYGQAATFPTVLVEALRHFRMDVSSVVRLRHIWNFLMYFTGLVCLGILTKLRWERNDVTFLLLLIHILTPRLFGETFYNDRDVMLISLFWISLLCFEIFLRKPGIFTALLSGFFFALAINTRYFGLVLLFLPAIYLLRREEKKKGSALILTLSIPLFFYLMTPVLWDNFFSQFAEGFRFFSSGQQRTQETKGLATILFFGKYIPENDLPFYYVPLWILISTPVVPQFLSLTGLIQSFRKKSGIIDRFMQMLLCLGLAAVMIIRPVLYNGWRHMYFFYVPVFWFAGTGIHWLLSKQQKWIRVAVFAIIFITAGWTAYRISYLHPYEYVYLNPLFSSHEDEFDRDYWRLSTTESLKWIWNQEQDLFRVCDTNAGINNHIISLFPWQRDHVIISQYNALHRVPSEYLIFNYSGAVGNEQMYPLYTSAYVIERDGVKLTEVFKRLPALTPMIKNISPGTPEMTDGEIDLETEWRSTALQNDKDELVIEFGEPLSIQGISLLPGNDEGEYARSPELSISTDGKSWQVIPVTVSNLFDLSFPQIETKWIRIRNTEPADVHWSFREILFYRNCS